MGYGKTIRDFRAAAELTQDQLAEKLGCSSGYIPALESEKRLPSLEFCLGLAEVTGRSEEDRQRLLEEVEAARSEREMNRSRARGAALKALPPIQAPAEKSEFKPAVGTGEQDIARAIAADPELRTAHEHLRSALSDPHMRATVLAALEAFARAAHSKEKIPDA